VDIWRQFASAESRTKLSTFTSLVSKAKIFDKPIFFQGWEYLKPSVYLAIAFLECDLDPQSAQEACDQLAAGKAT